MGRKKRSSKAKQKSENEELSATPTEVGLMEINLGDYTTMLPPNFTKFNNIYDKIGDNMFAKSTPEEDKEGEKGVQKDKKILVPRRGRIQNAKKVGQNVKKENPTHLDDLQVANTSSTSEPDGGGRTGRRGQKRKSSDVFGPIDNCIPTLTENNRRVTRTSLRKANQIAAVSTDQDDNVQFLQKKTPPFKMLPPGSELFLAYDDQVSDPNESFVTPVMDKRRKSLPRVVKLDPFASPKSTKQTKNQESNGCRLKESESPIIASTIVSSTEILSEDAKIDGALIVEDSGINVHTTTPDVTVDLAHSKDFELSSIQQSEQSLLDQQTCPPEAEHLKSTIIENQEDDNVKKKADLEGSDVSKTTILECQEDLDANVEKLNSDDKQANLPEEVDFKSILEVQDDNTTKFKSNLSDIPEELKTVILEDQDDDIFQEEEVSKIILECQAQDAQLKTVDQKANLPEESILKTPLEFPDDKIDKEKNQNFSEAPVLKTPPLEQNSEDGHVKKSLNPVNPSNPTNSSFAAIIAKKLANLKTNSETKSAFLSTTQFPEQPPPSPATPLLKKAPLKNDATIQDEPVSNDSIIVETPNINANANTSIDEENISTTENITFKDLDGILEENNVYCNKIYDANPWTQYLNMDLNQVIVPCTVGDAALQMRNDLNLSSFLENIKFLPVLDPDEIKDILDVDLKCPVNADGSFECSQCAMTFPELKDCQEHMSMCVQNIDDLSLIFNNDI